ncbi:hypothetical protein R3P38DRAFT_38355 [Favolaschia claudopus]|uniref:Uncharacterized protein n=1 Tax=Favolaschia claudopus TaxID=2862362 RepID=A0AAW0EJV5_9AGAR
MASKSFASPEHFTQKTGRWSCNLCKPTNHDPAHMNFRTALQHERNSVQHAQNVREANTWWNPMGEDAAVWNAPLEEDPPLTKQEIQMREHQYHVERVADIVPYWIKCVDAAAKGQELRLEPFLNSLYNASDSWATSNDSWGPAPELGWEAGGGWGPDVAKSNGSSGFGSRWRTGSVASEESPTTGYAFVENFARQESVTDVDRKHRLHKFFDMPTDEKVKKIDEIVRYLRESA